MGTQEQVEAAEKLLAEIQQLADKHADYAERIKLMSIRAVDELGAARIRTAAAAKVSRPTLNAWLKENES